jgi:hypothetical protein
MSEWSVYMSEYGDEVRKANLDPKVKEAVANIVDSAGSNGRWILGSLESEIKARQAHAEGKAAAEKADSVQGRDIGGHILAAIISQHPDLNLKKQLETIVASQGLKPADVDKLLDLYAEGERVSKLGDNPKWETSDKEAMWRAGQTIEETAGGQLSAAVQKGVDAAIDAPLRTPKAQETVVKQR